MSLPVFHRCHENLQAARNIPGRELPAASRRKARPSMQAILDGSSNETRACLCAMPACRQAGRTQTGRMASVPPGRGGKA